MTPTPPSSSDGSELPPKHRPDLGNLSKDSTEVDLWAFEDDFKLPEHAQAAGQVGEPEPKVADAPKPVGRILPTPRGRPSGTTTREIQDRPVLPNPPASPEEPIRKGVDKVRPTNRPSAPLAGQGTPANDFDDLDNWGDDEIPLKLVAGETDSELHESLSEPGSPAESGMAEEIEAAIPAPAVDPERADDEYSPAPPSLTEPRSSRPKLALTMVEKVGLISLILFLLVAAVSVVVFSLKRLPTESISDHEVDYPVKGSFITISSSTTYWRKPITDGPTPDTVRRDTLLIPVLEFNLSGGPAAVRLLFRNDEGAVVGDAVTRVVSSGGTVSIPATAGFDDFGMYAAYTTGRGPRWTIEVSEAKPDGATSNDFKKLFDLNISSDRR